MPAAVYRAGDLIIDTGRQRVTRSGEEIPLPKLSYELLLALVRAAPNIVPFETLLREVWPNVVVSPETLSQRVKLLRDALGDVPHEPRYVAGLRGRGYRLVPDSERIEQVQSGTGADRGAPVAAGQADRTSSIEAKHARELERSARRQHRSRIVAVAALCGAAIAAVIALLSLDRPPQPTSNTVTVAGLPPRTVAVLPFENLSADPGNEHLALGIAEMVLTRLAGVREIVVISRSSSFTFRGTGADAREIGHKLDARYLVEGGVQRVGQRLRVTARLIDADSGAQVEALHFDRALADIFAIQDEIADQLANALEAELSGTVANAGTARSDNLDAYLAYLQGRALIEKWTVDGFDEAARQFERAIALDPQFAAAYVGLAEAQTGAAWRRHQYREIEGMLPAPIVQKAARLVEQALLLDPSVGAAYLWRAHWLWSSDQVDRIEADFRKGLELDPSNGRGLTAFAEFLLNEGQRAQGRRVLDRALLVDPLSARAQYIKAFEFTHSRADFEQGMFEVLKMDPNFVSALTTLAWIHWMIHGEFAEAAKLAERAIAVDPDTPWSRHAAYLIYLDLGDLSAARDVADETLEKAGNARFQLFLYQGDRRAAGEAAYDVPDWLHGHYMNLNDAEAVRDLALDTKDYRRAIRYIEKDRRLEEPRKLAKLNFAAAVPLAHLLQLDGQPQAAAKLIDELLVWLERHDAPPWLSGQRRARANAFALQGRRGSALAELAAAFRSGDRTLWWYTVEHDPLYADMRHDPRFQALAAEARAHTVRQRVLLEEMRRKGDVPYRPARAAGPAGGVISLPHSLAIATRVSPLPFLAR